MRRRGSPRMAAAAGGGVSVLLRFDLAALLLEQRVTRAFLGLLRRGRRCSRWGVASRGC
jgi:hypothetical protein